MRFMSWPRTSGTNTTYSKGKKMKAKKEQVTKILKITFGVMFISVVMLFFFGEFFMPAEDPTGKGECTLFEAEWERVRTDGTKERVQLPGQCEAERGEAVRLVTTLPQNQDDIWLCMRASQQDMRVFVGDELRKEYSTKGTRLFGIDSASTFVFFEIEEEDAGKVLTIELVSNCEYAGFLNKVYAGEKYDIVRTLIRECSVVILVSFYMLILSSIVVLIGIILRVVYKRKVDITYLGLGVLQLSFAMISESRIRQFFLPNSSVAEHVGFFMTMLIPYPFMVYVNRIQKGRYEKIYRAISLCVAGNFLLSTLLQIFNILDLAETMMVSYCLIVVMVLAVAFTICLDIAKRKIHEYGELVIGIVVMLVVSLWETYITFVPAVTIDGGVLLSFGLIVLLFMAGFKAARDMLVVEQEKQMAIAAGEAKAQFLANMSHEIRTPINTIVGMNEMILRENRDEAVAEYATGVQNASKLLLGLINDILDFSKIEAGKMDILEADYYLSKMLTDVIKSIQMKAESKNLVLKAEIDENLPSVLKGDEIRIRQILNNLLSNAVKYTKQGTITLKVKGVHSPEGFVLQASVKDTGIGIKREDVDKLFDSFRRLEEKKNRYIEGTGLGLNITKQLAELMGGSIGVKSEYAKGSCFTVKIPQQVVNDTAIGKLEEAYQRDTVVKEELRATLYAPTAEVLVVDDNEMNLAVMKALLRRTGIKLTLADSGAECLELCRSKQFDLILMDHMMPDPDGIETLHLLRQDEDGINRDTDVIVITANAITGMAEMYLEEGFADYLSKPVVGEELEDMLLKHLPATKLEVEEGSAGAEDVEFTSAVTAKVESVRAVSVSSESVGVAAVESESVGAEDAGGASAKTEFTGGGTVDAETDSESIFHIDKKMGLAYCCNSEDVYREMCDTYYAQGQKYIQTLTDCFNARDWKNYKIAVHALKGTSLMIGAVAFSEKAKSLEMAAGEGNEALLFAECEHFLEEYKTLLEQVKA